MRQDEESGAPHFRSGYEKDELTAMVADVQEIVLRLALNDDLHFWIFVDQRGVVKFKQSDTGRGLLRAMRDMNAALARYGLVEQCKLNPFFEVFIDRYRFDSAELNIACGYYETIDPARRVEALSSFIHRIRVRCREPELKSLRKMLRRSAVHRARNMIDYVNHKFDQRSRLLATRLDLNYAQGEFLGVELREGMERVKRDWNAMYHALTSGLVEHLRGYVARIEYGILGGFHIHLLLLFAGSDRRADISINAIIGEHWEKKITLGSGRYWNCNKHKSQYARRAIGLIEYTDVVTRTNLEEIVIGYLAKPNAIIAWHLPGERTLFKGIVRKTSGVRRGRSRSGGF